MDRKEYYTEIERIAEWLTSGDYKEETGHDDEHTALHQLLDYHEYIISYHKAYQLMGLTDNADSIYYVEEPDVRKLNYSSINCLFARYAMEADIHDAISRQLMASAATREPCWVGKIVNSMNEQQEVSDDNS